MAIEEVTRPAAVQPAAETRQITGRLAHLWSLLRWHPSLLAGVLLLVVILANAVFGPMLVETDPLETMPRLAREGPSDAYPFGNDSSGRDILSRVVHAIRLDLGVALVVAGVATLIGSTIGLITGYLGGFIDQLLMRFVDILMAFPGFLLALTVTAVLGNNIRTIVFALGIAYAPVMIRVVRAQVLSLREAQFIEASQAIGTPTWEIIFYHLLPNTYSVLLAQATLFLAWAVLDIAGLSFLGLGIKPPTPELGAMTAEGAEQMISGRWWMSVFPGGFIMLMALTFTLIGDGLRDILDPRYQR
ncbi:MAG: ABC transporter permease [Chloroflexi bacterium]|nr:MAG: ABC transporter permease [Chloroflexota bacterium]